MAQNKQQFMAATEENTSRATTSYQFPSDLITNPTYGQNYMMFTAMKVSGGVDTRTLKFALAEGTPTSVVLPIPTGVNTQYQNSWDENQVGRTAQIVASKGKGVMQAIQRIAKQDTFTGMVGAAGSEAGSLAESAWAGMKTMPGMDVGAAKAAADTAGAGVVNEMMGFAATKPGIGSLLEAAQFDIGIRALKQTMTSYSGPGFRSFQWQFSMKPLSIGESDQAKAITQFFKTRSMPAQSDMQYTRIYNIPDVFRVQFFSGFKESPWIDKIGHCACTDVGIAYGGDRFTTFAGEHAPLQIDLSLSFKEMELLNRQAVQNEDNTGVWPEETYTKASKPYQDPEVYSVDDFQGINTNEGGGARRRASQTAT